MEPTDKELLAAHVAGDPDAFSQIVYRHRDRLWAVALRTLSDPDSAADALQDALISAYRRADQFRGDAAAQRLPDGLHPDADGVRIIAVAMREGIRRAAR
jgi:lysophospholipase L1-like esterase